MTRRDFITLLGGAAAWPLAARAQQPGRVVRIGFVGPAIDRPSLMFAPLYQAFLAQLHVLGFVEGQNLIVTYGAVDDPRGLPSSRPGWWQWRRKLSGSGGPKLLRQ